MKPDTHSGYASKGVNFPRMGARRDMHQKLSTFQGLIRIEKCQLSKKLDTHYTHYASKSVNFPREISTKPVFAELVYQKKTAVTLQASHRWEEDERGKGDAHHRIDTLGIRHGTALSFHEPGRCCRERASRRFGTGNLRRYRAPSRPITRSSPSFHIPLWDFITPAQSTHPDRPTGNTTTVPEMRAGANDPV